MTREEYETAFNEGYEEATAWKPIETIDGEDWRRRMFWLDWADDCKALNPPMPEEQRLFIGRRSRWSSTQKATHWQPIPKAPTD